MFLRKMMKYIVKKIYFDYLVRFASLLLYFFRSLFRVSNNDIKEMKNKFNGKRCFIVCTGPSLTIKDLNMIKHEYSFGMNSIIKVLDKTEWRPTFYGIQDYNVYYKMKDVILNYCDSDIFIANTILKETNDRPAKYRKFDLNLYGHKFISNSPFYKFSNNASNMVFDGFSITYSLLQIAVYMGFKNIYLIGCDCNYMSDPNKQHFVSSGHVDPNAQHMGRLQRGAFMTAKKYCDSHKVNVFNATRGGALEVFQRVDLDKIINQYEE